jgi:hypothetical protein
MKRSSRLHSAVLAQLRDEFRRDTMQIIEVPRYGPEILALMKQEAGALAQSTLAMIEHQRKRSAGQ